MQNGNGGLTLWFTGLPCSGKTTIAEIVKAKLEEENIPVELLDGDEIRKHFSKGIGFSKEDRNNHLRRIAYLCHLLTKHGVVVLACFVSPYRENREFARELIGKRFSEVFVDTPLEECVKRDVKGMYKRAIAGEIKQFTGISDPYERPIAAEMVIKAAVESPQESAGTTLDIIKTMLRKDGEVVLS